YIVSKNSLDPKVDIKYWRLEVDGLVENPLTFDYEQLKKLPAVAQYLTLECISNPVGGDQIGNALWKGVRMRDLLLQAGAKSSAIKVVLYGEDEYSDSIALSKAMEEGTLLAYEMNGETLTNGHGFPVRLLVPGIYGMKNVKWLTRIELVDYDYRGYWQERGWSDLAAIKTMSRIDVPAGRESGLSFLELMDLFTTPEEEERELKIEQDSALLGGIAFAGDRGISQVEVSTDDGQTWNKAQVKEALSPYTWVLWVYDWRPPGEGKLTIKVRAADSKGNLQPSEPADPLPDGASGYHSIVVRLVKE
ncbi:MAG: sulfite oxidase, partial [Chloroflexi bacterium]|nr:sulfite oxidase [Chloroflexota bacterium]